VEVGDLIHVPLLLDNVFAAVSYPYLTSINSVLPAIIAGNTVLLKPSPQTPLTAERLSLALHRAGLPGNVLQVLHLSPPLTTFVVQHPLVDFVSFTGSVAGGHLVEKAAVEAPGFKGVALEVTFFTLFHGSSTEKCRLKLGGKDPAYVRADADLAYTAAELVDGEKQSNTVLRSSHRLSRCILQFWPELLCSRGEVVPDVLSHNVLTLLPQRIYVHESVFDTFVDKFVGIAKVSRGIFVFAPYVTCLQSYRLDDPTKSETNLGPVVSLASAQRIRKQVKDAGW
jgi:acyl-CoA reductase-like NAD-dependent aldehyde dehydrogenase